ncbi:MAG: hypothetical protein HRT89_12610 [Lentisphaeria bacterium]|nr:hypothetical protein [Lentisphaeria bacterium]NQZ68899.1 hypothetical protein [Lentisphaeria bacterium]
MSIKKTIFFFGIGLSALFAEKELPVLNKYSFGMRQLSPEDSLKNVNKDMNSVFKQVSKIEELLKKVSQLDKFEVIDLENGTMKRLKDKARLYGVERQTRQALTEEIQLLLKEIQNYAVKREKKAKEKVEKAVLKRKVMLELTRKNLL